MNSAATAFSAQRSGNGIAVLWAGLTCGVMDITAALVVYGSVYGVPPLQLLQGIASGLLGRQAFRGGIATAALGLLLHFTIAFSAAAVYFFMQQVVALSATVKHSFSVQLMLIGVVIHIFCVGLPIALMVRKFSSR